MKNTFRAVFFFAALLLLAACHNKNQEEWISLFNGKNLAGWEAMEHPESFRVVDSAIVCHGDRAHLFYTGGPEKGIYKNFELKAMVMTMPGRPSGKFKS